MPKAICPKCSKENDKLEAEKKELIKSLMRIAFEVPCCAREEAREALTKIKSEGQC